MGCDPDPSVLLPLLLGLSRSTGGRRGDDGTSSSSAAAGRAGGRRRGTDRSSDRAALGSDRDDGGEGPDDADDAAGRNKADDEASRVASLPLPSRLHRLLGMDLAGMAWTGHGRSFRIPPDEGGDGNDGDLKFREGLGAYFPASDDDDVASAGGTESDTPGEEETGSDLPPATTARSWSRETLHRTLLGYGFRVTERQADGLGNGRYYHPRFLRGREDLAEGMAFDPALVPGEKKDAVSGGTDIDKAEGTDGDGLAEGGPGSPPYADSTPPPKDGGSGSAPESAGRQKGEEEELPAAVRDFMAFTSAPDPNAARQYLEMAGGDVGTAVSLYMDTGEFFRSGFGFGPRVISLGGAVCVGT